MTETGAQADHRRLNALLRADGSVVVPPRLSKWVLSLVEHDLSETRRKGRGGSLHFDVLELLDALQSAAPEPSASGSVATVTDIMKLGDVSQLLTSTRAAALLECTPRAVTLACNEGRLRGWKPGRHWLITTQDLDDFRFGRKAA